MRLWALSILALAAPAACYRATPRLAVWGSAAPAGVAPRSTTIVCSSAPQQQATLAASVLGLASQPIMWWSLYTLKTTGCGLPAGPFGLIGAAEGIA